MRKLKIGIVCYPTIGGSGVIATELGKSLAERGHTIHFISSSQPFRLKKMYPNIFFHEVSVNEYTLFQYRPYDIALSSKIAEISMREELDLIHAHYAIPHAFCTVIAREMSKLTFKIVTTLHGTDITVLSTDPTLLPAIKYSLDNSDAVTAVSNALLKETVSKVNPRMNITPIYNFVDQNIYRRTDAHHLKSQFKILSDEKVIVHVSNFRGVKRVDNVIKVFHKITEQIHAKLLLVGDGPEMAKIRSLVEKLNLTEKVIFLGNQDNITELYSISDLMLLLSEKESFGLVLIEAMSCGVPSISTNIGGIPEVVTDGKTGFLCEPYDLNDMVKKALIILKNDQIHKQFVNNCQREVTQRFSLPAIVNEYEQMYLNLF